MNSQQSPYIMFSKQSLLMARFGVLLLFCFIFTQNLHAADLIGKLNKKTFYNCVQDDGSLFYVEQVKTKKKNQKNSELTDEDLKVLFEKFDKRFNRALTKIAKFSAKIDKLEDKLENIKKAARKRVKKILKKTKKRVRRLSKRSTRDQGLRAGVLACDRGNFSDEPQEELTAGVPEFNASGTSSGLIAGKCSVEVNSFDDVGEAFGDLPQVVSLLSGKLLCTIDSAYPSSKIILSAKNNLNDTVVLPERELTLKSSEYLGAEVKTFELDLCPAEYPACTEAEEAKYALLDGSYVVEFRSPDGLLTGVTEFSEPGA